MKKVTQIIDKVESNFSLENEFLKSYENPYFKEIVDSLNLPKDKLQKYTSILDDCALDYENCKTCKNILSCKNKICGYAYLPRIVDGEIIFNYQPCKFKSKILKEEKITNNILLFNAPKEVKNAKMKDIYTDYKNRLPVIKWVTNFIEKYPNTKKGLFLHGSFGCGKSYLISAMFNELAKQKVKSAIVFWPDYLATLKMSFNTNEFNEKINEVKKVKLLLIDDIGAENMTPWTRDEILCPILQYRMQEELPTFFTSNMNIKELEHHLSVSKDSVDVLKARRIIERINQLTDDIEVISDNLRK